MELGDDGVRRQRIEGGWMRSGVVLKGNSLYLPVGSFCPAIISVKGVAELAGERGREVGCS